MNTAVVRIMTDTVGIMEDEAALVTILRVNERQGRNGSFKTLKVKEEQGWWFRTFRVNVFPNRKEYCNLKEGMQLLLKFTDFSKYYKNLKNFMITSFQSCDTCGKYLTHGKSCNCDGGFPESTKIQGKWLLTAKCQSSSLTGKPYYRCTLTQSGKEFCYCLFDDSLNYLTANEEYELEGWQNIETKYHVILFK